MRTIAQDTGTPKRPGAYALVQLADGQAKEVIELARTLPNVQSVEAIRGPYQLIARLSGDDAGPLRQLDGVVRVVTAKRLGGAGEGKVRSPGRVRRRGFAIPQPCGTPA